MINKLIYGKVVFKELFAAKPKELFTEVQKLSQSAALTSNQGIEQEIQELETQMEGLNKNSEEFEYDQLQLEREKIELETRKEHPNINPQTIAGNAALNQLLDQDPNFQAVTQQIQHILHANPSECLNWGIPTASSENIKVIQV